MESPCSVRRQGLGLYSWRLGGRQPPPALLRFRTTKSRRIQRVYRQEQLKAQRMAERELAQKAREELAKRREKEAKRREKEWAKEAKRQEKEAKQREKEEKQREKVWLRLPRPNSRMALNGLELVDACLSTIVVLSIRTTCLWGTGHHQVGGGKNNKCPLKRILGRVDFVT